MKFSQTHSTVYESIWAIIFIVWTNFTKACSVACFPVYSCGLPLQPVAGRKASNIRKDPWRGAGDKDEGERGGRVGPLDAVRGRVLQQFSSLKCIYIGGVNVVTVTENVNTFLLVWTHVSRCGIKWLLLGIQLFRERLSEKVRATIPKGVVGGF